MVVLLLVFLQQPTKRRCTNSKKRREGTRPHMSPAFSTVCRPKNNRQQTQPLPPRTFPVPASRPGIPAAGPAVDAGAAAALVRQRLPLLGGGFPSPNFSIDYVKALGKKKGRVRSPTACCALFSARTTLAEPRGTLVEPLWNPGGTAVEPSWNPRGTLPQGRSGPPRSLSGLRHQNFQ